MKIFYPSVLVMIVVLTGCDTPVTQIDSYDYSVEQQMGVSVGNVKSFV